MSEYSSHVQEAAYKIMESAEAASKACGGPRFTFQEFVDEVSGIIQREVVDKMAEQSGATIIDTLAELRREKEAEIKTAHDALRFVRQFFVNLENGAADDPVLSELRRKYHAPVHAEIDKVLGPR